MSLIHFTCKCSYSILLHNKTPIYSAWGLLTVCAVCPTPRLNQSYELRPPWEQHLRYVPHRVRNGYNRVPGLFPEVRLPRRGVDLSPRSSAAVEYVSCYNSNSTFSLCPHWYVIGWPLLITAQYQLTAFLQKLDIIAVCTAGNNPTAVYPYTHNKHYVYRADGLAWRPTGASGSNNQSLYKFRTSSSS